MYGVFYMSLLEQNITRKERVNKALSGPVKNVEFKAGSNKEYEVETIIDSAIYGQQANSN